ncbi:MAG: glycosyltransferase family 4 protein [Leptospira sp.]|nr:glycosyltransferase family 4 protein [Leptospira sp.]
MNVFYDHQIFSEQNYGGISRYFVELIKRFSTNNDNYCILPKIYSNNINIQELNLKNFVSYKAYESFLPKLNFKGKYRIFKLLSDLGLFINPFSINQKSSLSAIKKLEIDIIHPTYYSTYFLILAKEKRIPYVVTIYDMIHELFPDQFPDSDLIIANKKQSILNASLILAISQNTKNDIIKLYNISDKKIHVIPLASSLNFTRSKKELLMNTKQVEEYLLFIGNRSIYKNFAFFLESINSLLQSSNDLKLYCVGGGKPSNDEIFLIKRFKLESKVIFFQINNNLELSKFYKNAKLFIFPSIYEGFGIPILEAMNSGCLVACSNTSSFPEVAGNAAFYFNPTNKESILNTIQEALFNTKKRELVFKNMLKQRQKFSWDITFKKTLQAYEEVLSY